MRRDCGVNLVSGALQSSLARAQATYEFHGKNSAYNSEESKQRRKKLKAKSKLTAHLESIGSRFGSLNIDQLEEYGKELELAFTKGDLLPPLITEELQSKYTVLRDDVGPPPGVTWLPSYPCNPKKGKRVLSSEVGLVDHITPLILKQKRKGAVSTNLDCEAGHVVNGVTVNLKTSPVAKGSKKERRGNAEVAEDIGEVVSKTTGHKVTGSAPDTLTGGTKASIVSQKIKRLQQLIESTTVGKKKKKLIQRRIRKLLKKLGESDPAENCVKQQPEGVTKDETTVESIRKNSPLANSPVKKLGITNLVRNSSIQETTDVTPLKSKKSQKLALLAKKMGPESARNGDVATTGQSPSSNHHLPQPKRILFPKEKVLLGWRGKRNPGAGFHNFGNTCYLNSSLQALFHVPAFVNWLQNEEEHRSICNANNNYQSPCILCVVYITLQEHSKNQTPIRPRVLDKLKAICKHFGYGRQEDAHEFLRYLLEGMERSYLTAINGLKLDNRTKETNPLGQIFGGYIRTEVTCSKCNFVSTTFQPSSELQLDIRHITTLEDALTQHFRKERLDNNDYKCEKCRTISQATKQFSIEVPPLVLCLQLKRFTLYGTKISKRIHCNRQINIAKFVNKSRREAVLGENTELKYRLVALVTHMGQSPNCGHYTAISECSNGMYYQFDDQSVYQVSPQSALNNDAYVIIYEMDRSSRPTTAYSGPNASSTSPSAATAALKQHVPDGIQKKFTIPFAKSNGNMNGTATSPLPPNTPKTPGVLSNMDRKLLEFGSGRSRISNGLSSPVAPKKIQILKPGVALTNTQKLLPSSATVVTKNSGLKLVPYNDVDNEESDKEEQTPKESTPENSTPSPQDSSSSKVIEPVKGEHLSAARSKSPKPTITQTAVSDNAAKKSKSPDLSPTSRKRPAEAPQNVVPTKLAIKPHSLGGIGPTLKRSISPKLSATSEWTVTANKEKPSNGYSSDPESKLKSKELKSFKLSRAKSMERMLTKANDSTIKNCAPLVPNKILQNGTTDSELIKNESAKRNSTIQSIDDQSLTASRANRSQSSDVPSAKKRKRSLSSSSGSSSSSSSESAERKRKKKKKHMKKKEKRKSKRDSSSSSTSTSSSDTDDSDDSRRRKSKKHKKKKREHKKEDKKAKERKDSDRSVSRETDSEERDRIRRKCRNPSRSPFRPEIAEGERQKVDPSKLDSRGKIIGWNGQQSILSKCVDETKRHPEKTREELLDEELDLGKVKKLKKSRSPSREGDNVTRFQIVQDRKSAHRSTVLDDYGFKIHRNHDGNKSWESKNADDVKSGNHHHERYQQNSFGNHHRNNNNRHFGNFKNSQGSRNPNRYDNNRNWGHRNHR